LKPKHKFKENVKYTLRYLDKQYRVTGRRVLAKSKLRGFGGEV